MNIASGFPSPSKVIVPDPIDAEAPVSWYTPGNNVMPLLMPKLVNVGVAALN
jgi:hypothetical protein